MNIEIQKNTATSYDRYPFIFKEILTHVADSNDLKILSFGCSKGEEVKTLKKIYYQSAIIDGYDIKENLILQNIKDNVLNDVHYYHQGDKLDKKSYDVIFCMSVLCTFPQKHAGERIDWNLFNTILQDIDSLLKQGGYLIIYNTNYRFTESDISNNYEVIDTSYKEDKTIHAIGPNGEKIFYDGSGFVPKYDKEGNPIDEYPYYLFRKIR